MAPLRAIAAATLLFLSTVNAHFVLISPPSLEGTTVDEDKEGNAPCGADTADLSKKTTNSFHVDGDFIALLSGHPQINYLIRGTLEDKGSGNWTQLFPIFTQSGLGNFCEPSVSVPKEWAGKKGIIGVVADAPDGTLYQCAVVNFVAGSNSPPAGSCTNGSTVTGSFSSDPTLSGLVGNPSTTAASGSGSSATPSSSSGSTAPKPSQSGSVAAALSGNGVQLGGLVLASLMVALGTALL
ncbi:hypothetical protein QBC47DRAFT_413007 [Echria macrotheca]|uniref:Copper acquisition factor BIM1-like domain-containing protein n=1 Tax=Echria macrotheca TaxID=438768 RepID=A0AAJ0BG16_9PEZI|nr:hypothetical protein QBC47DRAFT_413007 [Echria macrotheca]